MLLDDSMVTFLQDLLYVNLEIINLSNNLLDYIPYYDIKLSNVYLTSFYEINLGTNQIRTIKPFSYWVIMVKSLILNSNLIDKIENDAFYNMRCLQNLILSFNYLTEIRKNNFNYMYNLVHLNLSNNRISYIETDSFENLDNLLILDLSFNEFYAIENNIFIGLKNLEALYLYSKYSIRLNMNSFAYLIQISNIFLNASIFRTNSNNLCVLTRSFERIVARKIKSTAKTFVFFKSINLIVSELSFVNNDIEKKFWCDLIIYFLQFNLHLNLKTDALFEVFYYSCENKLTINTNKFINNYNKCL